ncbi:hypothetical protein SETIT_5G365200v2 [Setaria italica]|uniref:Uncharacterized protein n=1 Tax=Setaria italica TaxID=4555 RepID=A0A368RCR9_SETIT|nr:hypothetical protein SETIT_5G365200v2 [Setaria italica]
MARGRLGGDSVRRQRRCTTPALWQGSAFHGVTRGSAREMRPHVAVAGAGGEVLRRGGLRGVGRRGDEVAACAVRGGRAAAPAGAGRGRPRRWLSGAAWPRGCGPGARRRPVWGEGLLMAATRCGVRRWWSCA